MPRGFKRNVGATEYARNNLGLFKDKRSFIGFIAGEPDIPHEILYGKDKEHRRYDIFQQSKGMCVLCSIPHFVPWEEGEWHHLKGGLTGRCDCKHNGAWICRAAHRRLHVHTRFGEHK